MDYHAKNHSLDFKELPFSTAANWDLGVLCAAYLQGGLPALSVFPSGTQSRLIEFWELFKALPQPWVKDYCSEMLRQDALLACN